MNKKMKCITLAVAATALSTLFASTAFAEAKKVTSEDGLITLTLPNEQWVQIPSIENTEVFSDGDCAILFDVYRADDELPGIVKTDDKHVIAYNASAATKDYVFVAVGLISTEYDYNVIRTAIDGIEVDQTKIVDSMLNHKIVADEFSIRDESYTAWVSADELNIRDDSLMDGKVLTVKQKGDELKVTGSVLKNGEEIGWARVDVNGTVGYVSAQFLSKEPVAPETEKQEVKPDAGPTQTGATYTFYRMDNTYFTVYEYTDGSLRDINGEVYTLYDNIRYLDSRGFYVYTVNPADYPDAFANEPTIDNHESDIVTEIGPNDFPVVNEYGATLYIHDGGDGYYYTSDGLQLWRNEAGIYIDTVSNIDYYR